MFRNLIIRLFLFVSFLLNAQTIPQIPDSLKTHADAVVIYSDETINYTPQKMIIQVKEQIIIYNKQAGNLANLSLGYDNYTKILKAQLTYSRPDGKLLKKVSKKDFKDYSASGNGTLYTDYRIKNYRYIPVTFPFVVTKEYKIQTSNTAFIPTWNPYPGYDVGIISNRYIFKYMPDIKIFKQEQNLQKFKIEKNIKLGEITYTAVNLSPITYEPLSPPFDALSPHVKLTANRFKLAGVPAQINNWNDFGRWMSTQLLSGRNKLPAKTVQEIQNLVRGINDPVKRAEKVYEYVQNKTRYIDIAIGIGGWQPMSAEKVDQLGYGDCKALTNYTKSLMDIAQVPAIYTIAYAGSQPKDIDTDLIGMQGNHVFLCLPQPKDTIWLECTSQKIPFGFINGFTDNRKVLTIKPKGGKIVKTKTFLAEDNLSVNQAEIFFDEKGNFKAQINIKSYGTQYDNHLGYLDGLTNRELKEKYQYLYNDLKKLEFQNIQITNNKRENVFEEKLKLSAQNYAETTAKGDLILMPNVFNRNTYVPPKVKNRKTDFVIKNGYQDKDIYTIHLPASFKLNQLPDNKLIKTSFGQYELSYKKIDEHNFIYQRKFTLYNGTYSKDQYVAYRKFRKKIKKLEKQKIIIKIL